jgi:predicted RNA-binding Zn-ribbon protein involved in translation (DUF1610 family)
VSHDRDALIVAYRMMHGGTHFEAERVVRGVELEFAEIFHKGALHDLDAADGQHLKETQELRLLVRELKQLSAAWQRRGPHSAATLAAMYRLLHGHELPKPDNTLVAYTAGSVWYCLSCGKDLTARDEVGRDQLLSDYVYRCDQCGTAIT